MNRSFVFCLIVVTHILGVRQGDAVKEARIIGGKPTTINRMPYLVYLRTDGVFNCGGTLIRRRFVVTAAHCVVGLTRGSRLTVTGGSSYLNREGVVRRVTKVMTPRNFNMRTMNMDVAVLKLSSSMTGRGITPIPLCSHRLRSRQSVRISGWGVTRADSSASSNQVRTAIIRLYSRGTCQRSFRGRATLTSSMMCGDVPGIRDSCSGDSGGPLISKGQLCGVVSWGFGCAVRGFPGVYTNINTVRKFIKRAITR